MISCREAAVRTAGFLVVCTLALSACQSGAIAPGHPSPSPGVSASVSPVVRDAVLPEHILVELGPYGVGSLGCDGKTVVWSTSSKPMQSRLDLIRAAGLAGSGAHAVGRGHLGGTVNDTVVVDGDWVVFMEYQQHQQEFTTDFWSLQAVNLSTGHSIEVAGASQRPVTLELPFYSLSGHFLVWDQLLASGQKVLRLRNLESGSEENIPLPESMYPTRPTMDGDTVVFLDNAADPDHAHEDFYSRNGQLMAYSLTTRKLRKLDSTTRASQPNFHGSTVVWSALVQDPQGPTGSTVPDVRLSPLDGGHYKVIAGLGSLPLLSNSYVVWYDTEQRRLFVYSLSSHESRRLMLANRQDLNSEYAVCGHQLIYALPPDVDGNVSRLRSFDLDQAFQ